MPLALSTWRKGVNTSRAYTKVVRGVMISRTACVRGVPAHILHGLEHSRRARAPVLTCICRCCVHPHV